RAVLGNLLVVCGLRFPLHAPQGARRESANRIRLKILRKPIPLNCRSSAKKQATSIRGISNCQCSRPTQNSKEPQKRCRYPWQFVFIRGFSS
ncbi:MAG: hypothetical protein LBT53_00630, partial [Puniceicoccales bacterium]|nr:hypothetical protein [Puniceicoccales bacterium]